MSVRKRHAGSSARRPLPAALAALVLGVVAGCDDNNANKSGSANPPPEGRQAETSPPPPYTPPSAPPAQRAEKDAKPPNSAPGAAPSAARLIGTWTVTRAEGVPPSDSTNSDRATTTTYRFEDGGRVTVAGSKQCAYSFDAMELKVDCSGKIMSGKIEFRSDQLMVWKTGANQTITLSKR